MFTIKHLDKVLGEVKGFHNKSIFSPKKSKLAHRLSKMNSQYRGGTIERMIRDYYISKKYNVKYFGGRNSFDMIVNGKKIEVKSALAQEKIVYGGVRKYTYQFKHICPKNFHKLIMVFIAPEGITVRVMDSRTVAKYMSSSRKHNDLYVDRRVFGKVLVA